MFSYARSHNIYLLYANLFSGSWWHGHGTCDKLLSGSILSFIIAVWWEWLLPSHPGLCSWNLGCSLGVSYHSQKHSCIWLMRVNFWGLVGYPNHYLAFLCKAVFQVQNNQFTNHLWDLGSAFDLVRKELGGHVITESVHSVLPAASVAHEVLCFPRLSVFLSLTVHREKLWIRDHSLLPKPLSERRLLWPHRKYFHLQLQSWAHWSHVSEIVQVFYPVSCC